MKTHAAAPTDEGTARTARFHGYGFTLCTGRAVDRFSVTGDAAEVTCASCLRKLAKVAVSK